MLFLSQSWVVFSFILLISGLWFISCLPSDYCLPLPPVFKSCEFLCLCRIICVYLCHNPSVYLHCSLLCFQPFPYMIPCPSLCVSFLSRCDSYLPLNPSVRLHASCVLPLSPCPLHPQNLYCFPCLIVLVLFYILWFSLL